jgi:EAL domain-containing protein (putative c-di-GMP-specific phosphodiesterase class I)
MTGGDEMPLRTAMTVPRDARRDLRSATPSDPVQDTSVSERLRDLSAQIVEVATDAIISKELLVRLRDRAGELVVPGKFLPAAERFGLIGALDRWVGCSFALDDFGTGYGAFTYLKTLPIKHLKIDIEFVRDLLENEASQHLVAATVQLARSFGQMTVAEGVEDARTLERLRELEVDYLQGYYLGRPEIVEVD